MKTLRELFDSNPAFKGILYAILGVAPILKEAFSRWTETPPANGWEIAAVLMGAAYAVAVTLKAFTSTSSQSPDKP